MASFIGMDIGGGSLKVALGDAQGTRLVTARMPENMVSAGELVSPETMALLIKNLRREQKIKDRDVVLVLDEDQAFFRHVTLPPMSERELRINLPFEFRDFVTEDLGEFVYDYAVDQMVYNDEGELERMELFAAAAPKRTVEGVRDMLRHAGLRLKVVIPAPMGYSRLLQDHIARVPEDAESDVVFVDLGQSATVVSLYHGANFEGQRNIDLGCNDLDQIIADLKDIDPHTASTYKATNFEGVLDEPRCLALCDRLAIEVSKVINFYNFNNPDKEIKRLYFLGGGAMIGQLTRAISQAITLDARGIQELLAPGVANDANAPVCALAIAALLEGEAM